MVVLETSTLLNRSGDGSPRLSKSGLTISYLTGYGGGGCECKDDQWFRTYRREEFRERRREYGDRTGRPEVLSGSDTDQTCEVVGALTGGTEGRPEGV